MRFRKPTDPEDWNIKTFIWYIKQKEYREFGVNWKEWKLRFIYIWYDGPHWAIEIGPFWMHISD